MKNNKFQTTALNRAARGMLKTEKGATAINSSYGFRNMALHLSGEELKIAWKKASSTLKKTQG